MMIQCIFDIFEDSKKKILKQVEDESTRRIEQFLPAL